jgi:hypothetical protein
MDMVALDSDSKLIVSWLVGGRDSSYAIEFMDNLRSRLANRIRLATDGHKAYLEAVEGAFGGDVDYAMLVKLYGEATSKGAERKYSPVNGSKKMVHALALYFVYYNFVRIHKSLKVTPAMAAGITGRLWSMEDVVKITDN